MDCVVSQLTLLTYLLRRVVWLQLLEQDNTLERLTKERVSEQHGSWVFRRQPQDDVAPIPALRGHGRVCILPYSSNRGGGKRTTLLHA